MPAMPPKKPLAAPPVTVAAGPAGTSTTLPTPTPAATNALITSPLVFKASFVSFSPLSSPSIWASATECPTIPSMMPAFLEMLLTASSVVPPKSSGRAMCASRELAV